MAEAGPGPGHEMADPVVVVADGRVVEAGPHTQLMRNGGLYSELYALQAKAYA
jgi:ATP-binding cassette subfamily B protein